MKNGVSSSAVYLLLVTDSVWQRKYVHLEAKEAVGQGKPAVLLWDSASGDKPWEQHVEEA